MKDFDNYFTDDTKHVYCERCGDKFDLDEMSNYEIEFNEYVCPSCYEDLLEEKMSEDESEDEE